MREQILTCLMVLLAACSGAPKKGESLDLTLPASDLMGVADLAASVDLTSPPSDPLKTPFATAYVEVNSNSFANAGCFQRGAQPLFGVAILFAANINATAAGKATLFFNPQVQAELDSGSVAALRSQGIKVLLDVLGNHQNAGWGCFTSYAEADAFAAQCADAVARYGLDGIDIDDEYSKCTPNDNSLVLAVTALRSRLGPGRYITKALFNDAAYFTPTYNGKRAGDLLDYGWEMSYGGSNYAGRLSPYVSAGMAKSKLSIGIDVNGADQAAAARFVQSGGYGGVMVYNVAKTSQANLSALSTTLFGSATTVKPGCLK